MTIPQLGARASRVEVFLGETISAVLGRQGVARRYRLLSDHDVENARQLYERGESLASVGLVFRVDAHTVLNAFQLDGIVTRSVGTNQWS